jgi:hypothetical protein
MPREWVFLECGECGTRYYRTTKNPKAQNQAKLELGEVLPPVSASGSGTRRRRSNPVWGL